MGRSRHQRSGFTLLETLVAIMLAVVVGVVSSRLFPSTLKLTNQAERAHDQINSSESAMRQLRADVQSASGIRCESPDTLTLEHGQGSSSVVWRLAGEDLVRTEGSRVSRWEHLPEPLSFEARDARVTVTTESGQRATLASEVLVLQRLTQR